MVLALRARTNRAERRRESQRGQALVEFALILPLFLLIVVGIIQFALVLNAWFDLNRLANQGARWAVVNQWPQDPDGAGPREGIAAACVSTPSVANCQPTLQEHLLQERITGVTTPCVEIDFIDTPTAGNPNNDVGDPVQVKVIAPVRFLQMPFVVLPGIYLSGTATMRLEQKPTRYSEGTGDTAC
ncbi:MAG: TadE/TadG family type IV pilus assembly protein [Gemmatimonadota bacterium]